MTGTFRMKQKLALLSLAATVMAVWFIVSTEDGQSLGRSFVYFVKTQVQF